MRAVDLIRTKRDGGPLERAALEWFVAGVTDGSLPDYQATALLMARGLRFRAAPPRRAAIGAGVLTGILNGASAMRDDESQGWEILK